MAQNFTDDCFAGGQVGQTGLQNMENNFACLKSLFSGADAPSNPVAGMTWFETDNKVLKVRNAANDAWVGLMHGDASQKIWVYRNDAMDGWVVDSSVSDRVLVAKGGTTYTTGGASAGSWTVSGLTMAHTHGVGTYAAPSHIHYLAVSGPVGYDGGSPLCMDGATGRLHTTEGGGGGTLYTYVYYYTGGPSATAITGTSAAASTSTVSSSAAWRPAAAVNTLQYLNL